MSAGRLACAIGRAALLLPTLGATPAVDTDAAAPSLAVVLRPDTDAARKVVGVTVEQRITLSGRPRPLSLVAPMRFAGFVPVAAMVAGLKVTDAAGTVETRVTDMTTPDGIPARRWTSTRAVAGVVTVRYHLPLTPFAQRGPPYGVKAAGLGIGGNSGSLLVLPEVTQITRSTIGWDLSRMAPGSRAVMAGGEGTITVEGPPDALLDRWLLAGPLTPGQPGQNRGFETYTLGTPPFDARAMMTWSRKAYQAIAGAFGYLGEPHHLLLIRALDAPSYATGTASTERQASLITVGSPDYWPGQKETDVRTTIAHEMTHQWVGSFGDTAAPWFTEGLTVYVSVTLPCEARLQRWSECAGEINEWAKAYYASEAREWPLARIEAAPFALEDVRRVPYGRGMVYFANLDAAIRARSNGRRTLLAALRPLFEQRQDGVPITIARWEAWLRREEGAAGVNLFRRTVLGGEAILPASAAFGPQLVASPMRWTEKGRVSNGFTWRDAHDRGGRAMP